MRSIFAAVFALTIVAQGTQAKEFMLAVGSRTFKSNGLIPLRSAYGDCGGRNLSPELHWSMPPKGTKSFAITAWDGDAPAPGGWWHWAAFDIPPSARSVPAGRALGNQATTSYGKAGYGGPCPPPGKPHHYRFVVYAIDVARLPAVTSATTAPQMVKLLRAHELAEGTLVGLFKR